MLGLYVHIPFCIKKCKYCDFKSFELHKSEKQRYLKYLKKEMYLYKEDIASEKMSSIFIGGGTPSVLNSQEIKELFDSIKENFNIDDNAEITMECNPGTLTLEKLKMMRNCGVNRLSIGLQAVQNKHLEYIGRVHTYEIFEKNYRQAIEVGFDNINIDLMYALPNQSREDWIESLEKVVNLNPTHISAYSLILEEDTKLFEMHEKNEFKLLDEDTDIEMYEYTIDYLNNNGYRQYEISNYAKEGFECKQNILYWKCEKYIGLGLSSSGFLNDTRYNNFSDMKKYEEMISNKMKPIESKEKLNTKDEIEESVFLGLRMNEGIKFDDFERKYKFNFKEEYKEEIKKLKELQLIDADDNSMKLTQKGREISNSVFVEFMR